MGGLKDRLIFGSGVSGFKPPRASNSAKEGTWPAYIVEHRKRLSVLATEQDISFTKMDFR
jgi:hypothetical protein